MGNENKYPLIPESFWEIQRRQSWISFFLFVMVFIFYLLTIGLLTLFVFIGFAAFAPESDFFNRSPFIKFSFLAVFISLIITLINFFQAKKDGARYILNNLGAYHPDPEDRYHLMFINILEQMKLASGLPELRGYIIPTINLNSLSLFDVDGKPVVAVTEGLLAEVSRDELEAVVAHETAHILKGDTYALTIISSLVAFYEKLVDLSRKKEDELSQDVLSRRQRTGGWSPLLYFGSFMSSLLLGFLVTTISRNRELMADATAVELGRNPEALARVIYKAHVSNSYLGEASLFTPLFLVPPDSRDITDSIWDRLFNTHPPVLKRIQLLASMNHKTLKEIVEEIKLQESNRQISRKEIASEEEWPEETKELIRKHKEMARAELSRESVWLVKTPDKKWSGPMHLAELVSLSYFTPALIVKNLHNNLEAPARDFPQIRFALYRQIKDQPLQAELTSRCPVCHSSLSETFYEGVKIKKCPVCQGKLVRMGDLEKIFARKEFDFSDRIKERAEEWRKLMLEPGHKKPDTKEKNTAFCPVCGLSLVIKPFNYYLTMPVYKCLKCQAIWFEEDELEILQSIVEKRTRDC